MGWHYIKLSGVFLLNCRCFAFCGKPRVLTISSLPDELLVQIFQFLELDDVLACERVCRRWKALAADDAIWRRIKIVCIAQRAQVCPKTVRIIKSHCNVIRHLRMQYVLKYPFISSLISRCKNLLSLEMIMCRIQVEIEEDLKQWPQLEKLNLKNSLLKSTRALLLPLDHFTELTFLGLSDFGMTPENCDSLLHCQYLNHIVIDKIICLELHYIKTLINTKQQTLETLHMYGGEAIDDDCLFLLAKCPKLTDLCIIACESLTDRALEGITELKPITHLQIWNNAVFSDAMIRKTLEHENLRKLQRLSLSQISNVTGSVVDIITEYYTDLRFLALYQCPKIEKNSYENQLKAKFKDINLILY